MKNICWFFRGSQNKLKFKYKMEGDYSKFKLEVKPAKRDFGAQIRRTGTTLIFLMDFTKRLLKILRWFTPNLKRTKIQA